MLRETLSLRRLLGAESAVRRCSAKKVLLKISQNPQKHACIRVSFFNKVAGFFRGHLQWLQVCMYTHLEMPRSE